MFWRTTNHRSQQPPNHIPGPSSPQRDDNDDHDNHKVETLRSAKTMEETPTTRTPKRLEQEDDNNNNNNKSVVDNGIRQHVQAKPVMPFKPSNGFMTVTARTGFLQWCELSELATASKDFRESSSSYSSNDDHTQQQQQDDRILSLHASSNPQDPLFFWQIYSIAGVQPILHVVTNFYRRIYHDTTQEWFRSVFGQLASQERHIQAQVQMWIDCMGGGRTYHGGTFRLEWHHSATQALTLMNQRGMQQWVHYMKETLQELQPRLKDVDPRLPGAISTFLQFFLEYYAHKFDFVVPVSEPLFGKLILPPNSSRRWTTDSASRTATENVQSSSSSSSHHTIRTTKHTEWDI